MQTPKQGFVIGKGNNRKQMYSAQGSYEKPIFTTLKEATVYYTYDEAKNAVKKLWSRGLFEAKVIPVSELYDGPDASTAESPKHNGVEWSGDNKRLKQNIAAMSPGSKEETEQTDTGHKFQKGATVRVKPGSKDSSKFGDEPVTVVVPDAKSDFVGVAKRGHEQNKDNIHLVHANDIEHTTRDGTSEDEEVSVKAEGTETTMHSDVRVGDGVSFNGRKYVVAQRSPDARASTLYIRPEDEPTGETVRVDRRQVTLTRPGVVPESVTTPPFPKDANGRVTPPADKEDDESLVNKLIPDVTREPYKSTQMLYKNEFDPEHQFSANQTQIVEPLDTKVKVPPVLISAMKAQIAEFKKAADFNAAGRDDVRGSFALTVHDALQTILDDLEIGTVAGLRQATIDLDKMMNPIYLQIPEEVILFIRNGGKPASLKDLFLQQKQKRVQDKAE